MDHFDIEDWCANLSAALTDLTETARLRSSFRFPGRVPIDDGLSPEEANAIAHENLIRLAQVAQQDHEWRSLLLRAHTESDDEKIEAVCSVLELHPVINAHFDTVGPPYIVFLGPPGSGGMGFPLDFLARDLVAPAFLFGPEETARLLHRLLSEGEARALVGYQITMFPGLHVDQRIDLDEGLFLASYEEVSTEYGPDPNLEYTDENHRHSIAPEEYNLLREDPSRVAALVHELRWGPAVGSMAVPSRIDARPLYSRAVMDASTFANEVETIRDILVIATGTHQWNWTSYVVLDEWLTDLLGVYRRPGRSFRRYPNDWWRTNDPPDGWAELFRTMAHQRRDYRGNKEQLDYAISRIASSHSRAGRFQVADSIADLAIALESMYELDAPEITYKLRTRAAVFLESEPEKRKVTFDKVRDFYRVRSNIVHGSVPGERQREVMEAGREIARRTLLAILGRGEMPDWDLFVLSAGVGSGSS